jgi:hypothetical protein
MKCKFSVKLAHVYILSCQLFAALLSSGYETGRFHLRCVKVVYRDQSFAPIAGMAPQPMQQRGFYGARGNERRSGSAAHRI